MRFDIEAEDIKMIRYLRSERDKLKAAIWEIIAGTPAYKIEIVAKMIKELECIENERGNPMDGYEIDCGHNYEWECGDCPANPNNSDKE